jgi:hypothetical protein
MARVAGRTGHSQTEREIAMTKNERGLRLHEGLTCMGWIAGDEAHSLAYWTMRLADEIEDVGRYAVAHRSLRELAWEGIRPFTTCQNAVSARYAYDIQQFLSRHEGRFSSKYRQTLDEIRKAMRSMGSVPAITGRTVDDQLSLAA